MKKTENPCTTLDGEDAFPDFGNPEWVEKMLARAKKQAAQRPEPEKSQQTEQPRPASSSDG